jgi:hypothetical protein
VRPIVQPPVSQENNNKTKAENPMLVRDGVQDLMYLFILVYLTSCKIVADYFSLLSWSVLTRKESTVGSLPRAIIHPHHIIISVNPDHLIPSGWWSRFEHDFGEDTSIESIKGVFLAIEKD